MFRIADWSSGCYDGGNGGGFRGEVSFLMASAGCMARHGGRGVRERLRGRRKIAEARGRGAERLRDGLMVCENERKE
ncbi:MAG TPA: hypothetical protein DDY12_06340 [Porphyromonadaceae bacterium]|nr:hypothetical protein [Porphyromonadaceae bacterium]